MIRIENKNYERINELLDSIQNKRMKRTITVDDIFNAVHDVEDMFRIPKRHYVGIEVRCDINATKYAKSYKYTPKSTQFTIYRRPTGWYVGDIERYDTGRTDFIYNVICLPTDTKEALINRFYKF